MASRVVPMRSADDRRHAATLVFEYMASTQAEAGRPLPADISALPPVLRAECEGLAEVYRPPGTLLLAYQGEQAAGCVGLRPASIAGTLEVRRLYVRPGHRRAGIARRLVDRAHQHAARRGFSRLVLDVMRSRTHVIAFYRRLGYVEMTPADAESPDSMISMHAQVARTPG